MENNQRMCGIKFYTIDDLVILLGWSRKTIQKMFNDPKFPSVNYGKPKVVEEEALRAFFAKRHDKEREVYWK